MTMRSFGNHVLPCLKRAVSGVLVTLVGLSFVEIGGLNRMIEPHISAQGAVTPPVKHTLTSAVFTEQQAERGREIYERVCAFCHRTDLSGNEDGAPALRGAAFLKRWSDRPLADLSFI